MRTTNLLISTLLIGIVLAMTTAWSQEDMTVVDNAAFDNPQRPPSVFVHDEHNEAAGIDDCASCHHVYEDGDAVKVACRLPSEVFAPFDAPALTEIGAELDGIFNNILAKVPEA